jgi:glycine/D-amino acid oxidase-like deaminating enzyme
MSANTSTDAIVIGAGVVGSSCAYHLARAGLRVLVAETFGGPAEGSSGFIYFDTADDAGVVLLARKTAR